MTRKVRADAVGALAGLLFDGMTVMAGGLGQSGVPETLIAAIRASGVTGLTVVSNNCGLDGYGLGLLLEAGQIRKMVMSYVGENRLFQQRYLAGELELELCPQGTLAERIRAGAAGVPAFFTRTGVGTPVAEGKAIRVFDGAAHVLERGLTADLAVVKAWRGDDAGNLVYRGLAQNFNPLMAAAGGVTVAEVEELVEVGALDPDQIHTPGIYVDRLVCGAVPEARPAEAAAPARARSGGAAPRAGWTRDEMAARAAAELHDGCSANLGVGIPTLVAAHVPAGMAVTLQTANTLHRVGLAGAGEPTATAFCDSASGFAMIRGGRVDLAILGALQVAANGDLANWMAPGQSVKGMGGAMDLVAGVRRVVVLMEQGERSGAPKLVQACTLPLTGAGVVDRLITDLGVFDLDRGRRPLTLVDLAPGVTVEEVRAKTGAAVEVGLSTD
jgi:3-oxoacid CoA-transferase